ncbi:MAG: hypothetical protein M5U28_28195 [Sandaracinaceae bacterium]|nr:hypothetical protein [Sandaracinaceae bacterium]
MTTLAPDAIMRGIIDAFEPDILVTDDTEEAERLGYPKERVVPWADMFKETLSERPGLAMYFVYEGLYEEEFQYQLRHPPHARRPRSSPTDACASPRSDVRVDPRR